MTKNRIFCILSLMLLSSALWAQSSISDINRIKRDKDYIYGEATLDKKEAALKLAYELLEVEIKNWAARKDPKISSVLASKVHEYADTIILKRHNMVRAFVYVKTSNLKAVKGKSLTVEVNNDTPVTLPPPSVEEQAEPVIEVADTPAPLTVPTAKPIREEVLEQLMAIESFYDLEKAMKPLKQAGKITDFGKYTTMGNPAECYLIIYDKQAQIVAVLDKGTDKRRNLKTGLDDSEKNYHGCGAIWLKIKE